MDGIIYIEDGRVIKGKGLGKTGTSLGELVFNTSMTGYQEILTDPSYGGQIITMTYPLIGNYGVSMEFSESDSVHARGFIIKSASETPSNYKSQMSIDDMLKKMGVVCVCGVDTRMITKHIRKEGALKCAISNDGTPVEELKKMVEGYVADDDWMKSAGTKEVYKIEGSGANVALVDFGVKGNIVRSLVNRDCNITVFPYGFSAEEILEGGFDGVLLSNGPGDPEKAVEAVEQIKKLIGKIPMLGICMGHQLISLAVGGQTYKMKYGHRGGNHGVLDIPKGRGYITTQNHGYAVLEESIKDEGMVVTHRNLNDGTVEGMKHEKFPVFSVQFHPEACPGPEDSMHIFDDFIEIMKG